MAASKAAIIEKIPSKRVWDRGSSIVSAMMDSEEILEWAKNAENALMGGVAHPAFVAGMERGGPAKSGGILWCDWQSFEPITGIRQIVGHTPGHEVRYKKGDVCLDTHLHHYGLLEDGELTIVEQH